MCRELSCLLRGVPFLCLSAAPKLGETPSLAYSQNCGDRILILVDHSIQPRDVRPEFVTEPLGKTTASPVSARTGRRRNLCRFVGVLGNVNPQRLATGIRRLSTGVVDADVPFELGIEDSPMVVLVKYCAARKGRGVFVVAIDGFSIPLPPALAGLNFHHDGRHLVNLQTTSY